MKQNMKKTLYFLMEQVYNFRMFLGDILDKIEFV